MKKSNKVSKKTKTIKKPKKYAQPNKMQTRSKAARARIAGPAALRSRGTSDESSVHQGLWIKGS